MDFKKGNKKQQLVFATVNLEPLLVMANTGTFIRLAEIKRQSSFTSVLTNGLSLTVPSYMGYSCTSSFHTDYSVLFIVLNSNVLKETLEMSTLDE